MNWQNSLHPTGIYRNTTLTKWEMQASKIIFSKEVTTSIILSSVYVVVFRSYYSLKLYDGGKKFSKLEFKFYTLTKRFMSAVTRVSATNVTDMNLFLCETFNFQGMR